MKEAVIFSFVFSIVLITGVSIYISSAEEYPSYPPQIFSSDSFPCSKCHAEMQIDRRRRELSFHTDVKIQRHGEPKRWCLDCHDAGDRDKLVLINGERVDFRDSYLLCGQCHGNIFRVWKAGIHGKRTGYWDGQRQYFLCTYCHNPHSPRFKPLAPERAPLRPERTLRR